MDQAVSSDYPTSQSRIQRAALVRPAAVKTNSLAAPPSTEVTPEQVIPLDDDFKHF